MFRTFTFARDLAEHAVNLGLSAIRRGSTPSTSFAAGALRKDLFHSSARLNFSRKSHRRFEYEVEPQYERFKSRGRFFENPRFPIFAGFAAVGGGVVYVTHLETVPFSDRTRFIWLGVENERRIGQKTFDQVKSAARMEKALLPDSHPAARMVRKIGHRLERAVASSSERGLDHIRSHPFEYIVVDSKVANAFAAPGGKICVFTGLIKLCANEDELAAVLAHELSHVVARHGAEKMSYLLLYQLFKVVWWMVVGFGGGTVDALAALLLALPYSRRMETEADLIGLRLTARACFDPRAMESIFHKLAQTEEAMLHGHQVPAYLRTHPESKSRSKLIQQELPDAFKEFEAAGCSEDLLGKMRSAFTGRGGDGGGEDRSGGQLDASGVEVMIRPNGSGTMPAGAAAGQWGDEDPWKNKRPGVGL